MVQEVWQSSGGSRALFEDGLRQRLGTVNGGKRFLTALSLACGVQMALVPGGDAFAQQYYIYDSIVDSGATVTGKVIEGPSVKQIFWAQRVDSGGLAVSTTLMQGGVQMVYSGGVASSTTLSAGGYLALQPGASAHDVKQMSGGAIYGFEDYYEYVGYIGMVYAVGIPISVGNDGTYLSGTNAAGSAFTLDNGLATNFMLYGGMTVGDDGSAVSTTLMENGTQSIESGGTALFTVISAGGSQTIGGGLAVSTTIHSGGMQEFKHEGGGGSALTTTIHGGGSQVVRGGGTALFTTIHSGGYQAVGEWEWGAAAVSTTINAGGEQIIQRNGTASFTTVNSGGRHSINENNTSSLNIFQSQGGNVDVTVDRKYGISVYVSGTNESGGFSLQNANASGFIVYAGGTHRVENGGSSVDITQKSGGNVNVFVDASQDGISTYVSGTHEGGSSFLLSNGNASGFVVYSGGIHHVGNGGSSVDITQKSGGNVNVLFSAGNGTYVSGTHEGGTSFLLSNGSASGFILYDNGYMNIGSGGFAESTTVHGGGLIHIDGAGRVNSATIGSGGQLSFAGNSGSATHVIQEEGGMIDFTIDATNGLVISGSSYRGDFSLKDGVASGFIIYGEMNVDGIGEQTLKSGGSSIDTLIASGGLLKISSGGYASAVSQSVGGGIKVTAAGGDGTYVAGNNASGAFSLSNGSASNFIVYDRGELSISSGGQAFKTTLSGGRMDVYPHGFISATVIDAGRVTLGGGSAFSTTINSYGNLEVGGYGYSGGFASGTIVNQGGMITVDGEDSLATDTMINYGGVITIKRSGTASATTVGSGGTMLVEEGIVDTATISAGGILGIDIQGGTLVGSIHLKEDSRLIANGAVVLRDADTSLIIDHNHDDRLAVSFEGSGGLVKGGSGVLTLLGVNTYTGGTVVSGGTIVAGNNSAFGTSTVTMHGGTSLGFAGSHTLANDFTLSGSATFDTDGHSATLSGVVGGGGSLIKTNSGILTLAGTNVYSGDTVVSSGTLAVTGTLGSDNAYSGNIANAASLIFNQSANQTLTGALSGSGTLVKEGDGKLILNAPANSIEGTVNVNAGQFIVGGTSAYSSVTLTATGGVRVQGRGREENERATLGGHGTMIAGNMTLFDGILSPGNSYGKLTIKGNVLFDENSWLYVELNPKSIDLDNYGEGDRLIVEGTVDLSKGTVKHIKGDTEDRTASTEDWKNKTWKILEVSSKLGEDNKFAGVESEYVLLVPELIYEPKAVFLSFSRNSAGFNDPAETPDEEVVAKVIESLDPNGSLSKDLLDVTKDQARRVLNELSGELHATLKGTLFRRGDTFTRRLVRHVGDTRRGVALRSGADGDDLWISVDRATADADGSRNAARAVWNGTEIAFGHDADLGHGWLGGFAFGLDAGQLEVKRRRSEADVTTGLAALYGGKELPLDSGTLRFLLTGAFARHEVESERNVLIGSRNQKLETTYAGNAFTGAFETAYRFWPTETLVLEPYASLAWHHLRMDGFKERGGSAALRRGGESWNRATSLLGVRFSTLPQARVSFDADVGWRHLYGRATPESAFVFREGSDKFRIRGADVSKNAAVLGLSVGVKLTDKAKLRLQYDGELGTRGKSHEGQVVLEIKW